jgi:Ca2+-binding RTX toxin-like protein
MAVALAAAIMPTPALGASVTHAPGSFRLRFLADPGEANRVTVTRTGSTLTVTDPGADVLRARGDCGPLRPGVVSCPAADIIALDVRTGDGNDDITDATGLGGELHGGSGEDYLDGRGGFDGLDGGAGPDVIVARDGVADEPVVCGRGQDLAIVDRRDHVARSAKNGCEQVDDGSETTPRPGRVYVQPQRCASSDAARLRLPPMHRLVPLRYSIMLPTGFERRPAPIFDASDCHVRLTATPGQGRRASADVSGGPARLEQFGYRMVDTLLTIVPPRCAVGRSARAAQRGHRRLRVKTDRRQGHWEVAGKHSLGASYGTDWTTIDACLQTTTVVRRGRVAVARISDEQPTGSSGGCGGPCPPAAAPAPAPRRRTTVTVRAGHEYVVRDGP